jgi:hypothetical protein
VDDFRLNSGIARECMLNGVLVGVRGGVGSDQREEEFLEFRGA